MIQPVNNMCLIEVLDEFSGLVHGRRDEQKGIVREISIMPVHLTASTGLIMDLNEPAMAAVAIKVQSWVGKTVRYALYADADSSSWQEDGKTLVLVPWYRVLGVESDVEPTTDSKK